MTGEERFLSLEVVAETFEVRSSWLAEVYELGLIGPTARAGARRGESIVLAVSDLDRVAHIIRLHFHQGVDLQGIALLFARQDVRASGTSSRRRRH